MSSEHSRSDPADDLEVAADSNEVVPGSCKEAIKLKSAKGTDTGHSIVSAGVDFI